MAKRETPKANSALAKNAARVTEDAATRVRDSGDDLPDAKVLGEHIKKLNALNADSAEVRGEIGALVKDGETTHNIHRKAMKLVATIERMDETKRAEFLRHFFHYLEARELRVQPALFDGDTDGAAAAVH